MTNYKSLVKSFNAFIQWFFLICYFKKRGKQPQEVRNKEGIKDLLLSSCNSMGYFSSTWLLVAWEIMPRSRLHYHNAWILYVFEAFFSKSRTDLLCFIWVLFEPFLYLQQRFCSHLLFYLSSILGEVMACFILDYSSSKSYSLISPQPSFLKLESVSFAFSFQNYVLDSAFLSLVSVVLSLSLSVSNCTKVRGELTSNLLFLKNSTKVALAAFCCLR